METEPGRRTAPMVFVWIIIFGGIGFCAGFFGPLVFAPDANQGPLVGILLSGPGGVVLGAILAVFCKAVGLPVAIQWHVLWICGTLFGLVVLYLIMPGPEFHGYIEDVQIESCERPIDVADDAIRYWRGQIAPRPEAARPGWEKDSREMLAQDGGIVLTVTITRQESISEERKPWNKGSIQAGGWQDVGTQKTFYARYAGGSCDAYPAGTQTKLFDDLYFYGYPKNLGWPPQKVVNFLNLQTLEPVPAEYRAAIDG